LRLLNGVNWYEPVDPASQPEWSFERLLLQEAEVLFPSFYMAEFKRRLSSPAGNVQPDLVLVERRFRTWHLVEVERVDHSLYNHVLPQVERIASARIDRRIADQIAAVFPDEHRRRVAALVEDEPHLTTVIVNGPALGWSEPIRRLGARLAEVEIFRDAWNRRILRVNGEQPEGRGEVLSSLAPGDDWFRGAFHVLTPAAIEPTTTLMVRTENGIENWRVERFNTDLYLFPDYSAADVGPCDLIQSDDGTLSLRFGRKRGR
jgi:hypothetical protein